MGKDAVVVEADAIKNSDSITRSLSRMDSVRSSPDLLKYVHEYSTMAAETLLINAGTPPGTCLAGPLQCSLCGR